MSFEKLVSLPLGSQTNRHWLEGMSLFDYRDYGSRWVFQRSKHPFQCSIPCFYVFFCYILLKPNRNIWKQLKTALPTCAQTEKQCVRLCLIWPNSPPKTVLRKKNVRSAAFFFQTNAASLRQTDAFQIWNPALFFSPQKSDVPRILPFRHIHLLLCLVSHRLFILAFISAITAVPIWSLRAKWKPVVSLRCRLKVSACNGSWHFFFPTAFLQRFWHSTASHYRTRSTCRLLEKYEENMRK